MSKKSELGRKKRTTNNTLDAVNALVTKRITPNLADSFFTRSPLLDYASEINRPVPNAMNTANHLLIQLNAALLGHGREYPNYGTELTDAFLKTQEVIDLLKKVVHKL